MAIQRGASNAVTALDRASLRGIGDRLPICDVARGNEGSYRNTYARFHRGMGSRRTKNVEWNASAFQ